MFTMTTGDSFGEIALLSDVPRTADVRALSDCMLLSLSKTDFHSVLAKFPDARVQRYAPTTLTALTALTVLMAHLLHSHCTHCTHCTRTAHLLHTYRTYHTPTTHLPHTYHTPTAHLLHAYRTYCTRTRRWSRATPRLDIGI